MTKRIVALLLVVVCMVGIVGSAMASSNLVRSVQATDGGGSKKCSHTTFRYKGRTYSYYTQNGLRCRHFYTDYTCVKCGGLKRVWTDEQYYDVKTGKWRSKW